MKTEVRSTIGSFISGKKVDEIRAEEEKKATCTKKYLLKMVEPNPFSSFCCGRFASCGHYFKTPFKLPVFFFFFLAAACWQ